jgi:hypothetical protein
MRSLEERDAEIVAEIRALREERVGIQQDIKTAKARLLVDAY